MQTALQQLLNSPPRTRIAAAAAPETAVAAITTPNAEVAADTYVDAVCASSASHAASAAHAPMFMGAKPKAMCLKAKPKAMVSVQTAVAADYVTDRKSPQKTTATYMPWEEQLARLPYGATDEARIANIEKLARKIDVVQACMKDPKTLPEPYRDAKKRLKFLRRELRADMEFDKSKLDKQFDIASHYKHSKFDMKPTRKDPATVSSSDGENEDKGRGNSRTPQQLPRPPPAHMLRFAEPSVKRQRTAVAAQTSMRSTDGTAVAASNFSEDDEVLRDAIDEHARMLTSQSVSRK